MSNLLDYLLELAADPDRCARVKADPHCELRGTMLSDTEREAVATLNARTIAEVIANENLERAIVMQWLSAVFSEPGG
jgi:hypothetical protein